MMPNGDMRERDLNHFAKFFVDSQKLSLFGLFLAGVYFLGVCVQSKALKADFGSLAL
jgi:hypothetical protein